MTDVNKPLAFSRFGADEGRTVVYFHGAPGASAECRVFDRAGKQHGLAFVCFDLFAIAPALRGERYFEALAVEISALARGGPIDIVGFSIGRPYPWRLICNPLFPVVRRRRHGSAACRIIPAFIGRCRTFVNNWVEHNTQQGAM
jgi:hypothetical protein